MAKTLEPLSVSHDDFAFPVTELLTGRGFVTGKSGSGKSNTASVVAEELLERGLGLLIVDTDGEYRGLAQRYELLHAGADADCDMRIDAADADRLVDLALEENVPVVLDVSGYHEEEAAREVVHDVVETLFVAEKRHRKPFLLLVEEAHEFMPQQGGGDDLSEILIRVAKRGRKRGLGICAMSQRPAAVDKDYITQCNWLVWHRLTWETDTDVAGRILGGDAAETVQTLDTGEALVMTDWDESIERVTFRRKRTPDVGATPTLEEAYGAPESRRSHVAADAEEDSWASGAEDDSSGSGAEEDSSGSGKTVRYESATAHEPNESRADPADRMAESLPNGATPADANPTERTAAADGRPERRPRRLRNGTDPEPGDPLWEIGQLFVYLSDVVLESHWRFRRRIERLVRGGVRSVRRRTRRGSGEGERSVRVERWIAVWLSRGLVFLFYVAVIAAVVVLV